jgi:hypothetical protein
MQIGPFLTSHFQIPSWHVMLSPHGSDTQTVPDGRSHAAPSLPAISGHGAVPFGAYSQFHTLDACGRAPQFTEHPGSLQHVEQPQEAFVYPHAVVSGIEHALLSIGTDAGQPAASSVQLMGRLVSAQ